MNTQAAPKSKIHTLTKSGVVVARITERADRYVADISGVVAHFGSLEAAKAFANREVQ